MLDAGVPFSSSSCSHFPSGETARENGKAEKTIKAESVLANVISCNIFADEVDRENIFSLLSYGGLLNYFGKFYENRCLAKKVFAVIKQEGIEIRSSAFAESAEIV